MPKSIEIVDQERKLRQIRTLIENFEQELPKDDLRQKIRSLVPVMEELRALGSSLIPKELARSASDRILHYLKQYPQQIVGGHELLVVSGISEYARRIRELRVQSGWKILSGQSIREMIREGEVLEDLNQLSKMKVDDYILLDTEQDKQTAHRWHVANSIRKKSGSVQNKIILYLLENIGEKVTIEELRYVAGNKSEWARRIRELRTEEGWPIATRHTGRPDLPTGVYVLESDQQQETHDRKIPDNVRVLVLERDKFSCVLCGWNQSQRKKEDPRQLIELHHVQHHADKGANIAENLVVLCNVCHDGVHAKTIELKR